MQKNILNKLIPFIKTEERTEWLNTIQEWKKKNFLYLIIMESQILNRNSF